MRAARLGLAGFFAISVPVNLGHEGGDLSASVSPVTPPSGPLTPLPPGWPGPVPEVGDDHAFDVWSQTYRQCERFGIAGKAVQMFQVMWEESRLDPDVVSPCGLYQGISQFLPSTFYRNVRAMRRLGLVSVEADYSPLNPGQAIEVMAWMWSKGYSNHWGPYLRVARSLERQSSAREVPN